MKSFFVQLPLLGGLSFALVSIAFRLGSDHSHYHGHLQTLKKSQRYLISLKSTLISSSPTWEPSSFFGKWIDETINNLNAADPLTPIPLDKDFSDNIGSIGKKLVYFRAAAYHSKYLRYLRTISFVGEGYDVLQIVAIPRQGYDIPILGLDIVTLPGKNTFLSSLIYMIMRFNS